MTPLVWTAAPLVVTLLAICWLSWRARPRQSSRAADTISANEQFRAALGRSQERVRRS